ncbi:hypothetical protein TruAng_005486 [Truncatella angustata]|nr:hypothetical protein TruAng_005486 [Truncatella angustata]
MIDNLAVAQAASPPMKAVDTAGMVLGFVPYHWAQAAGFGIQVAAGVGTAGISAARTKAFFKKVNEMYLNPRGLKVSIKKDEDLVALLGLPANGPALGPSDMNREPIALRDRRMQILAPHIAPLTLEVPPPAEQRSVLDRISARQVSKRIAKQEKDFVKKFDKQSRKSEKRRRKGKEGYIIKVEAKQLEDIAKLQYLVIENLYG